MSQAQIDARQPIVNTAQVTSDQINSTTSTATITVVTVDGLNLITSVAPESVSAPGTVTFTFVIANDGTGEATGLELVDALIDQRMIDCDPATDGIQGVPAALGAGVTIACAVPFDVDQDDIDAGEAIVTTARATSDQVASNESTATITITQAPALTLEKAVEPTTVDSLGNVTYSFTTQNTGNVTLTGIQLIDPHIDIHLVDCDPAADGAQSLPTMLAVGSDAVTCAVPYAIDQDDLDAGTPIENSAQVTSDQVASNESSATVTIEQRPGVSLQKAVAPVTISAAGEVTYAFTIKNTGNLTLTGIELIDPRVDPALIDCDPESDGAQAVPSTLAVGSDAVTCTVPYEIDQDQVDARQPVVNTAMVTSDQVDSAESSATVTIVPVDGLSLVASVDPSSVDALGEVTFTFVIVNHGGASVSGLALDATLIDRDLLDCDPADGIQGVPSSLGAGDGVICTAPHTVTQNTIDAGDPLTTGATATSDQAASNEASATVSIEQRPEIAVTKTVTSATSDLDTGDLVTYAITVTNSGNVTLSDIEVLDPGADIMDCGTMPDALAPDGVVECTASTELTEVHLLAGSYTNEVSVRAVFRAPAVDAQPRARTFGFAQMDDTVLAVESTATATVTMRAVVVGLTLEHSVEPAGPVRVGDTLTYTFVVTNTGNVGLHEVAIHAPLAGLVWDPAYPDGVIGTLPRDTTVTVTATYVVTPADAEVGRVAIETVVVAVDPTCEPEDDCRLAVEPSEAGGETVIEPDPVNPEPTATVEPTVPGATPTETSESTPGATEAPATEAPAMEASPTEVAGDTPGTVTDLPTTGHGVERSISLLHLGLLLAAGLALVAGIGRVVETRRRT